MVYQSAGERKMLKMYIDLTTNVSQNSPLIQWANSQDNPHVAMGHIGTHLDTYEKTDIPLEYFKSEGILFDVRGVPETTTDHVNMDMIRPGDFVLFRTGRIEEHAYGEPAYFENHPQLSHELIAALTEKGIRFIGVDCPGIRQHSEHEAADRLCEQRGIYIIENLKNLDQIHSRRFTVYTMWLEDEEMTGLRCRVIAECSE